MSRITDYSFGFQDMLGRANKNTIGSFHLSQINSKDLLISIVETDFK